MCHRGERRLRQGTVRLVSPFNQSHLDLFLKLSLQFKKGLLSVDKNNPFLHNSENYLCRSVQVRKQNYKDGYGRIYIRIKKGYLTFHSRTCWLNSPYKAVVFVFDAGA